MRLWHKDLIPYLPKLQLLSQLQESTKLKAKSTNCKIYKVKCEIVEEIKE